MIETFQRTETIQPLHEAAQGLVKEMGEQPQQRLDWFMGQTAESFGNVLIDVNSAACGLNAEAHNFDGEYVQAGSVDGSVPPDQEDKINLLSELVSAAQQHIVSQAEAGEDPQTIVSELAVAVPVILNKLHLFANGNGRTSRMLRMVLRDGDQINTEKVGALVQRGGLERYDASPITPVEDGVLDYMRHANGAADVDVIHDAVDSGMAANDMHATLRQRFPNLSPAVAGAYLDGANFSETVRVLGKDAGSETVSLNALFDKISNDPNELAAFTATYRHVRKQRVKLLMDGLMNKIPIPLIEDEKQKDVRVWVNTGRFHRGLPPIDPANVRTIQDMQMAYCETHAPDRDAA